MSLQSSLAQQALAHRHQAPCPIAQKPVTVRRVSKALRKGVIVHDAAPDGAATAPNPTKSEKVVGGQSNVVAAPSKAATAASGGKGPKMSPMDGNEAAAYIAYQLSDVSFIYPITPSTPMGELADQWASEGRKNAWSNVLSVTEMESETGAAGALHGALAAGCMATSFTCSQGLLLMIPNMYKIAGELMPCVLHVTARAIAKHALSIFGDHQDVMAVRQTGWGMLCSHSVQEAQDLALASHLVTLRSSVPFVHFFDGFRTSHEINKISVISEADVKSIVNQEVYQDAILHHQQRALNPAHPHQRGTAQGSDVYFQMAEACNPYYDAIPDHMEKVFDEVAAITGRRYTPFDYVGHPQAERAIIIMGSGSLIVEEAVNHMIAKGEKVGVLKVRMYRPWSAKHFLGSLPASVKRVCVMDRTKESGAHADPLYLDVIATLAEHEAETNAPRRIVTSGRYGLASKEFTPAMAVAVFNDLAAAKPRKRFTVGIVDDVTHLSLPYGPEINTMPKGTFQCMFWGMGSDGTVGANKEAVKIIADNTPLFAQAYFSYDAHKSGGVTVSHLRFGPEPITASYLVEQADYLAVHHASYMNKYDVLSKIRPGGVLVVNTVFTTQEQISKYLPTTVKKRMAEVKPEFYVIDARAVAEKTGLGKHINMVMQTVFFQLSGVLPIEKAIALLKKSIEKAYSKKGPEVVAKNQAAVDQAVSALRKIEIPAEWATIDTPVVSPAPASKEAATSKLAFIEDVVKPMLALEGDRLPVSVFSPSGFMPPGTTVIEKRAIAAQVPTWVSENCTQCNICSFICPHAAIRPALATPSETASAPSSFNMIKAKGAGLGEYQYRMQVSPYDCTGCTLCVHACPDKALVNKPIASVLEIEDKNWDFFKTLPERTGVLDRTSVKGSQFAVPLLEFSGACEGCGETPYVKLLTQMFGERLIIANATGCSSIWGGSAPSNPYTTNQEGFGPAWANSLFEDNAQFGLGIAMATVQRRRILHRHVQEALADSGVQMSAELRGKLNEWVGHWQDSDVANPVGRELIKMLNEEYKKFPDPHNMDQTVLRLWNERDMLPKPSIWIIGGDGWAYDIGFGGLDHVLASGENINIMVLDTEMYSNTGGQKSKSTPLGAVTKFAAGGKTRPKKDLGAIAMGYGDVYVASACLESNYGQVVKAMNEAEKYNGVSLILAYSPCVMQGIEGGMCNAIEEARTITDSGYWPLYRFNPAIPEDEAHHRFQLDSKKAIKGDVDDVMHHENRFTILERKAPETAKALHAELDASNRERLERMKKMAKGETVTPPHTVHPEPPQTPPASQ
uniref:pyruvate dehydrogenase (NADP(+)) n=2 Tax=Chlamydomonas leiostraca TaxID=1034604 RepID=A0A7S0RJ95_9CHLO|mmetsp:Transcript_24083/g.61292  ORF Transcript_24083/g.61292 Transcript_24083/m.61292 type:complete len:1302 (+) Transcript_24083:189-4094(+)|eukprot:CAMPEP_0202865188 /NCGR_PEP_ID=MMETSP1391-20130828/5321_1 /ASSEMBLY_ACC=CAM_ASM_000867 /TAXON_ID=1034604 /ORGANISM="Chlamydomonas leiostraca, Strain SAG 11-49" /LENGTH=1301 /DNA_ID=CAMNT_0049544993 /DNA_START=157 /DNA_END=4062 /DNA_ORIENTATION=-